MSAYEALGAAERVGDALTTGRGGRYREGQGGGGGLIRSAMRQKENNNKKLEKEQEIWKEGRKEKGRVKGGAPRTEGEPAASRSSSSIADRIRLDEK